VSSLWTPGGEVPVPPRPSSPAGGSPGGRPEPEDADVDELDELDPEGLAATQEAILAEMERAREQLATVPAADVVANHVMGFYELAAIHLLQQPPHLHDAALAIDAMGAVVEGLTGRLGQHEPTLVDALSQIRIAFVQVKAGNGS
jgi:hypothetical protein